MLATASQAAPDEPLERVAPAEAAARALAKRFAARDIPDHREIRAVRAMVGERPPLG